MRRHSSLTSSCTRILAGFALAAAHLVAAQDRNIKDEAKVPPYVLPDALTTLAGAPVRSAEDWNAFRRPEILSIYQEDVYGRSPAAPSDMVPQVVEEDRSALAGTAHRKQIEIRFPGSPGSPVLHLLLYTPAAATGPVPVFLCLHFGRNWAIIDDPGIRLYERWDDKTRQRVMPAPDSKRGTAKEWDVPLVLARGYGIAVMHYGDIEPDWSDGTGIDHGVRAMFRQQGDTGRKPNDWGAIGAWAWGLSRAVDALIGDAQVDGTKLVAFGQSRLGKTVLWAAAQDQRIAMVVASCSGEGGASLSRRDFGENLDNMTTTYLYQFCDGFSRFYRKWGDLPVDAHLLLSLIAPRPVLLNTGSEDLWSDPRGEFLALQAASPVYALFGKAGVAGDAFPAEDVPLMRDVGYHRHRGGHAVLVDDWRVFLDFADRHFGSAH